jgi:tetratricopeptide (TPR) repeat protein
MADLGRHLTQLDAAGLVRLFTDSPELEYLFRHALVQDAAYSSLLRSDRRRLHAEVGAVLESLDPDRHADLAALLGHHFHQAGDDVKARAYFEQAADHALAVYSNAEAAGHYAAALDLTPDAPTRARLLYQLGLARERQGQPLAAVAAWREALAHYEALGDRDALARVYAALAGAIYRAGDLPGALRVCDQGWAAVGSQPDSLGRFALANTTARLYHFNGRVSEARHWSREGLALARRLGDPIAEAEALITLGTAGAHLAAETIAAFEGAIDLGMVAGADIAGPLMALAHQNLAVTLWEQGEFRRARDHFTEALRLYRRHQHVGSALHSAGSLCVMDMMRGDFTTVRQQLPPLLAQARALGEVHAARTVVPVAAAWFARLAGRLAEARDSLRMLLDHAWAENNVQFSIVDSQLLVDTLLEQQAYAEAEAVLTAVLPLCDRDILLGRVWPRARLAEIAAAQGDLAGAHLRLAEARELAGPQPHLLDTEAQALAAAALAVAVGDWDAALAAYADAAAAQTTMGRVWYRAHTWRAAAAAHRARGLAGDAAAARALLQEARAVFVELDVSYYTALVDADLALL